MSEGGKARSLGVEGLVILASILLAFAIDAWWGEWDQSSEIEQSLEGLEEDFRVNVDQLGQTVATHRTRYDSLMRFSEMTPEEIRAIPEESLAWWWTAMLGPRSFEAETGTLDALVSSGRLGLVESRELRTELARFRSRLSDSQEERDWMQDESLRIWRYTQMMGGPWRTMVDIALDARLNPEITHAELLSLRSDPVFMGMVRLQITFALAYASELLDAEAVATRILELLEAR